MDEALIIQDLTVIPVNLRQGLTHYMYAKKLKKKSILIYNVHPLMDAKSLFNFFKLFGEVTSLRYSPPEAQALFEYDKLECIENILSTPMNKIYQFQLTSIDIPESYLNRNPEWIIDYQKAKNDSR
ncbi:unnamed protein product [Heterobilharzia americana]|nr:unnamed protein product [Heterobilharzia americana]